MSEFRTFKLRAVSGGSFNWENDREEEVAFPVDRFDRGPGQPTIIREIGLYELLRDWSKDLGYEPVDPNMVSFTDPCGPPNLQRNRVADTRLAGTDIWARIFVTQV
jgi:hypothetical protein